MILSVDTHLELMRAIGEVQDAPVIADIDTGYGNAVNVAYLVPLYAAAGVAAVVIEDKTFPKDSSLRPGGRQILVPVEEFQGKIEAARLSRGPLSPDRGADRRARPRPSAETRRSLRRSRRRRRA
jgi:2-methylisocitrate lyase-like PEP mutase family enzyme